VATTASTSLSVTGLTAGTTYSMTVKAKDPAGNISAASAVLDVTTVKPIVTYTLTVNSGTGSGHYVSGISVNISANAPATNKVFDKWTGATTGIADVNSASTNLTMPAANIVITATYKDIPAITYTLTINSGTGSGNYTAGTIVNYLGPCS